MRARLPAASFSPIPANAVANAGAFNQDAVVPMLSTIVAALAGGAVGVAIENDIVAGSDRDYTSGIKLVYAFPDNKGGKLARIFLSADDGDRARLIVGAGQNIYTPKTYRLPVPPPGEHPYAGWLYVDGALIVERDSGNIIDILGVSAGVVGPAALGEDAQRTLHRLFNDVDPLGWNNQLRNEPGLAISFDRQWKHRFKLGEVLEFEASPFAGASAGNVLTEGRAGFSLSIGEDLKNDLGPVRVRSSIPGGGIDRRHGVAWSVFGGAAARAVARNIFLDGNTFRNGPSVEKEILVGEFQAGLSISFGLANLSYTHVWRTRQYETEPDGHSFGALSLSRRF
jgi:hypothetical protein